MSAILPFLQLCRLPTVFTAIADVFLGYLLVHRSLRSGTEQTVTDFLLLLGATSGLYLSGMVFNDVFDRRQDAAERPHRPIPSGRVSLRAAVLFGGSLMLVGLVCAAIVGWSTFVVAGMLAICVLAYDGGLKRTPVGPVGMGSCRFLNLIMAASSDWLRFEQVWWRPQLWVAAGMGVYIAGVTWFARTEARHSSRRQLAGAAMVVNLGLTVLFGWASQWPSQQTAAVFFALGVIVLTINRRLLLAILDPAPARVQAAF
ncbi:MAG: UbiA family prenyltransferase [Planctomycetaceae bacterium]